MRIKDILPVKNATNGLPKDIINVLNESGIETIYELQYMDAMDIMDKTSLNIGQAEKVNDYIERLTRVLDDGFYAYTYKTNCRCISCGNKLRTSDRIGQAFLCYDCDETYMLDEAEIQDHIVISIPVGTNTEDIKKLSDLSKMFVESEWINEFRYKDGEIELHFDGESVDYNDIKYVIYGLNQDSISPCDSDGCTANMIEF